ncbi:hypothetical protein B9Z55_000417 [Caenorhabditis nigoni]|uniref:Uncharacterized protein n=1 Tax=Caenorhabditis nigoni TaxID=1611254 RepID=A0A2G5VT33_9PELO|nr:hypothetical protein B9Z55_000417 [Caenorhabditis nigoni]
MGLIQLYTSFSLFFSVLFLCVSFIVIYDIFDEIHEFYEMIETDMKKFKMARRNNLVVQQAQLVESDHSDDESDDESPDEKSPEDSEDSEENSEDVPEDSENSEREKEEKEEEKSEKEEKVTFADILKKSLSVEEPEESSSGILGPKFPKNLDSGPSWGPSKLGLVTDDVDHLPSISSIRPPLETKESEEIDALLGESEENENDDFYDLDDFEDGEEKVPEKPVNIVSPIVQKKKEEVTTTVPQVDPLVLSDESIDELEDFDAGALSSGGSDFSW